MNETTTQDTEAQPIALNTDASIAGAAAFAGAETAEILNLLGDDSAGGSCCGGSCCLPGEG
ncbi:MAG: hypothetical protein KA158_03650 [Leucobacter sp.]|nr:hypothetical protein [Leucobacter sp.]